MERLKDLDVKIASAINKVKQLKEEKTLLESQVSALQKKLAETEDRLLQKDEEIRLISSEKLTIKDQIEDLLNELESIEVSG